MRVVLTLLALAVAGCAGSGLPAAPLQTPAQACDYRCTSTHAQVVAHLDALAGWSALRVGTFGTSGEGRALPLAVWGADAASPEAARRTGKTRVLIIGNIHGGEVAGKDAMLELLSDLATGSHAAWADSLVVAVAPIYNADGNERMGLDNRPRQDGPVDGMGQRPNAAGLDLNRDFMKVASPEARALVGLLRDLDPHVVVDLHTTNGTAMGYHLTYAPGLSPNTPAAIDADLRDRWLPSISAEILASDDFATYHYGNVPGAFGEAAAAPRGWYSYSPQPRFSSNYAGLRGRYGLLSEAYSYAPFAERVAVSRRFVEEILDRAWADASHVRQRTEQADATSVVGQTLAVRAEFDALDAPVEILLGAVDTLAHPVSGAMVLRRQPARTPERMPAFVRFAPSETVRAPAAYVVRGDAAPAVRALLDIHGIQYQTGIEAGARDGFRLDSVRTAERAFQQVAMQEAFGEWERTSQPADPAALVVPVGQPLGRLAVALFEPRSDDGLVAWGMFRAALAADGYPVERIPDR
ncbi:M14 family zinc carboxypeptidase [Rubrivirga sp. IMCC43871]|uniref:M14 family metallopeptidase n=1 Tax=Rubrivirga sp. IMCC43871 TaxID=3391575 RepID=UPI00398FCED0